MVFHRLMCESDASYLDDLLRLGAAGGGGGGGGGGAGGGRGGASGGYGGQGGRAQPPPPPPRRSAAPPTPLPRFGLDGWVDTTNIAGRFEASAYVRALARYLDETLDVYEGINFYLGGPDGGAASAAAARLRSLAGPDLLFQLPRLQRLLLRLADCVPTGPAAADPIVQASCLAVAQESFRAYRAASEGLINLADRFFDMDAADAGRGADAYRQAAAVTARLQAFYQAAEGLPGLRAALQFPRLEPPPPDFLAQMEAYIREGGAPSPLGDALPPPASGAGGVGGGGGGGGAVVHAPAPLPARPAASGLPLRRGTRAPPPPHPAVATNGGGGLARPPGLVLAAPPPGGGAPPPPSPEPATPAAGIVATTPAAPAGPAPVDALFNMFGGSSGGGEAAAAPAPAAATAADPFELACGGDPFAPAAPAAPAPPQAPSTTSPAPALSLVGSNPFGDATALAPPVLTPAAAAAPPAAPAWAGAPAAAASPSPPRPAAPTTAAAPQPPDPFAGLLGGLSLGPSPASAPPLRKAAPPAGTPMGGADRAARFAAAAGTLPGGAPASQPAGAGVATPPVSPPAAVVTTGSGTSPWG